MDCGWWARLLRGLGGGDVNQRRVLLESHYDNRNPFKDFWLWSLDGRSSFFLNVEMLTIQYRKALCCEYLLPYLHRYLPSYLHRYLPRYLWQIADSKFISNRFYPSIDIACWIAYDRSERMTRPRFSGYIILKALHQRPSLPPISNSMNSLVWDHERFAHEVKNI